MRVRSRIPENGICGNLFGPVPWLTGSYREPDFPGINKQRIGYQ
jgi:hypothetical protein